MYKRQVRGSTVQSRNLGHDIMAGFRTLVGGEVTDYAEMLTEARQIATGRMAKNAEELGADAVVILFINLFKENKLKFFNINTPA